MWKALGYLLDEKWPGDVLLLHLLYRSNSSAKACKLCELLLDFEKPLLPLPVGKVGLRVGSGLAAIPLVQFLKLHYFGTQRSDLFA